MLLFRVSVVLTCCLAHTSCSVNCLWTTADRDPSCHTLPFPCLFPSLVCTEPREMSFPCRFCIWKYCRDWRNRSSVFLNEPWYRVFSFFGFSHWDVWLSLTVVLCDYIPGALYHSGRLLCSCSCADILWYWIFLRLFFFLWFSCSFVCELMCLN